VIHAKKDASAVLVHRYVLEKSVGRKLRSDEQACHSCDRPECFEVSHLWVGTNAENTTDCVAKGRNVKGSRTGAALLNEKSVASIKMLLRGGTSQALCAALFGVSVSAIGAVKRGVNWGYIASDVSGASPLPKRRRIILKRRERNCTVLDYLATAATWPGRFPSRATRVYSGRFVCPVVIRAPTLVGV
jgi:hypothetical protein